MIISDLQDFVVNSYIITQNFIASVVNKDIESFMVIISFDNNASVIEFHNDSKEGNDWHHMHIDPKYKNRVLAKVVNFNRDDTIRFRIRVGDVTVNNCKVVESGCTGFKIKIVYNKKMI